MIAKSAACRWRELVFYIQVAILLGIGRNPIDIGQHMLVKLAQPARTGAVTTNPVG